MAKRDPNQPRLDALRNPLRRRLLRRYVEASEMLSPKELSLLEKQHRWEESGSTYPNGPKYDEEIKHGCHGETPSGWIPRWAISDDGEYKYKPHIWSWAHKPNCLAWARDAPPVIHKYPVPEEQYTHETNADAVCDFRFAPEKFEGVEWEGAEVACYRVDVPLPDWRYEGYPGEKLSKVSTTRMSKPCRRKSNARGRT